MFPAVDGPVCFLIGLMALFAAAHGKDFSPNHPSAMFNEPPPPHAVLPPRRWALVCRRMVWLPTWRGWLCLVVLLGCVAGALLPRLHSFLAISRPVPAAVLVIEGWLPDYLLQAAMDEFRTNGYRALVTSGGPLPKGYLVSGYPTYAELTGAALRKLGFPPAQLVEAPGAATYRERTRRSAEAVRAKLAELKLASQGVNVITEGPHARRTLAVFRSVFPAPEAVGVISLPSQEYDPRRWWNTSEGLKDTVIEAIGWLREWAVGAGSD